tara:strand:- start:246 stop:482 length:237 start_codon:yes stop_codon:yes gene_type:complete
MDIEKSVKNCVARILEIPASSLSLESSVDNVKSWDSLNHMKLILSLEGELGITFSDDEVVELTSIESLIAAVDDHLND